MQAAGLPLPVSCFLFSSQESRAKTLKIEQFCLNKLLAHGQPFGENMNVESPDTGKNLMTQAGQIIPKAKAQKG
jgi:hypothetical protein